MLQKDIRTSPPYREAEAFYKAIRQPGKGLVSDAAEVHASPDGQHAVFAGTIVQELEGAPPTRICEVALVTGEVRVLTSGPNTDRLPKYSPDGRLVAFLSDRHRSGDFQLYLLVRASGDVSPLPRVDGWVEYFHWSPKGGAILLGVAGHGADVAGGQGAVTSKQVTEALPSWMPSVEAGDESCRWRSAWVYGFATNSVRGVSRKELNIWEAVWCGEQRIGAIVSNAPGEGLWYSARLCTIEIGSGESREVYVPNDQLAAPAANPSGSCLAVVEGVCSDRSIMAGDLRVIETSSGRVARIDTRGVNVTTAEWCAEGSLLLAGVRGFETVVSLYHAASGELIDLWASREVSTAGHYINASALNASGDCVLISEGFTRAPEIAVVRQGRYSSVKSFDLGYGREVSAVGAAEAVTWHAADGLQIQGWLLRPRGDGPYPLIVNIHGGPVSNWRPVWLGRPRTVPVMLLLRRGYAVFFPNPRGSSGRGQDFARHVLGNMGGADTHDHLSGVDHLINLGIADAQRLGVMGISYGGFMTAWLITQDARFAAAVAVAPITNHVSEHLISNIPHFVSSFLADSYTNPNGKYFSRSPIMHAHEAKTPTLNICGALDRCTPPAEATQFHNALLENNVMSALITYPEEGHGVRKFPAAIDYAARVVSWFDEHLRKGRGGAA